MPIWSDKALSEPRAGGHSVALLARMVAEAVPESPTEDARGNALQQALIWSGSPPGRAQLPKPLPLPPAQREGRTQNMRSTLIKNCCVIGAESKNFGSCLKEVKPAVMYDGEAEREATSLAAARQPGR